MKIANFRVLLTSTITALLCSKISFGVVQNESTTTVVRNSESEELVTPTGSWVKDQENVTSAPPPDVDEETGAGDDINSIALCVSGLVAQNKTSEQINCLCFNLCPQNLEEQSRKEVVDRFYGRLVEFSCIIAVYALMFIVGVFGNLLVIITVATVMKRESVTNIFLAGLSAADLLLVLFCLPLKLYEYVGYFWKLGEFLCRASYYMKDVSFICSVLMLTVISIERYLAICWPMKAQLICTPKKARIIVVSMWVLAFALAIPSAFPYTVKPKSVALPPFAFCTIKISTISLHYKLWLFYLFVVIFLFPAVIMSIVYMRCCCVLWQSAKNSIKMQNVSSNRNAVEKNGKEDNRGKHQSERRIKVIKMLMLVLFLFVACWGQNLIYKVIRTFSNEHALNSHWVRVNFTVDTIAMSNSIFNPIIYGLLSSSFRRGFRSVLLCRCKARDAKSRYAPTTRATNASSFADTSLSVVTGRPTDVNGTKNAETIHM